MKSIKRTVSTLIAAATACSAFAIVAPASIAADSGAVTASERSFPATATARKNLLEEATSTEVEEDSSWGGIESLDVPKTKSQSEKDAEAQQEQQAAAAQTQSQADTSSSAAASRSATRTSLPEVPSSKNGSAIAEYASQFQGYPYAAGGNTPSGWDCSGFVQYVFSQFGITLPHSSSAQATVGVAVANLAQAQPGDIIANGSHAAIYIGNGMVMNAMNPYQGTSVASIGVFSGSYSIRRILE